MKETRNVLILGAPEKDGKVEHRNCHKINAEIGHFGEKNSQGEVMEKIKFF